MTRLVKCLLSLLFIWISTKTSTRSVFATPSCYFALERKQPVETTPREHHSEVSTKCGGGDLIRMQDLEKNRNKVHGTVNELELVLARGAGLFVDATPHYAHMKFINEYICPAHLDELSRRWDSKEWERHIRKRGVKNERICGITTHERSITQRPHFLTKEQANKYLNNNHRLYHVGLPICGYHATEIDKLPAVKAKETEEAKKTKQEAMDTSFDENHPEVIAANRQELQQAFTKFCSQAKISGSCPAPNFGLFLRDTQMRRMNAMKKLVKVVASLLAPNDEDAFMRLYVDTLIPRTWKDSAETKLAKVFTMVAEQYEKTEDRRSKEIILSSIVNVIGLRELQNYIPGVSSRKYHNAKVRARSSTPIKEPVIIRTRYEPIRINYFVQFITSPIVSMGLPYGERTVKTSDGSSLSIPNTIRLHRNAEIIRMYHKKMRDTGKGTLLISDSVAYGILKKCSATRRHALTCLDYFIAIGSDAFEDIENILSTLQGSALLDSDLAKIWKYNVAQAKLYLKTDFRMHLKMESKVIDHCYLHSLSDATNPLFKHTGGKTHEHAVKCPRCAAMESSFNDIQTMLESLYGSMDNGHPSKKTISEMMIRMEKNVEAILSMKKHFVRAGYTDLERTRLIANLKDGEAFVTMDYIQKFLATWKNEDQRRYFGKRGYSWHCFHIISKVGGVYVQASMIHVLHTNKQDTHSVTQMLGHVLKKLHDVQVHSAHFRADNAGAYHSLGTVATIPRLAAESGVKVLSLSFSEAQNGKSSCDRVASTVKRKLRDYVDRGNNILNEKDLFTAIAASDIKGLSVYRATVQREKTEAAQQLLKNALHPKIESISDFGHFSYNGDSVRVWKMNAIGPGQLFKNLKGFDKNITIEESGGYLPSKESAEADEASIKKGEKPERFWMAYAAKGTTVEEPDDVDEIGSHGEETHGGPTTGSFTCDVCGTTYNDYRRLLRHLDLERHRIRPERIHLYDYAMQLFKQSLEDIQAHNNILGEMSEAMTELATGEDRSAEEGWALKGKRKHVTHNPKAKQFAHKLFYQGDKSGRKIDPAEVERLMKEDDKILPSERLTAQQIKSYFSTLCKTKKATRMRRVVDVKNEEEEEECEDLSEEDEENIDDFGRQQDDVIHDIIQESLEELFQNPNAPFIDPDV